MNNDIKKELKFREQQLKESIKLMDLTAANNFILVKKFTKLHQEISNKIYKLKGKLKGEIKNET